MFIITPDGSQTYSYTNTTQLYKNLKKQNNTEIMDSDHKFTDMVKEFQISSLTELFDSFGDSTLYKLPTATKA